MWARRPTAALSAPVSSRATFDEKQRGYWGDPAGLEEYFCIYQGEVIRPDYVSAQLTPMLQDLVETLLIYPHGQQRLRTFERTNDVVYLHVDIAFAEPNTTRIVLHELYVRPCFVRQRMPTLVLYTLLRVAQMRGDVGELVMEQCVPTAALILQRKFGDLVTLTNHINESPNCVIQPFRVSAAMLRIKDMLWDDHDLAMELNPAAFPTAEQLNDPEWVETNT